MGFDNQKLLESLRCPACQGRLTFLSGGEQEENEEIAD